MPRPVGDNTDQPALKQVPNLVFWLVADQPALKRVPHSDLQYAAAKLDVRRVLGIGLKNPAQTMVIANASFEVTRGVEAYSTNDRNICDPQLIFHVAAGRWARHCIVCRAEAGLACVGYNLNFLGFFRLSWIVMISISSFPNL